MFTKTLQSTISYANLLETQGIRLNIPGQSPLSVLMSYSAADNPQVYEPANNFIERIKNVTVMKGGMTEHDNAISTVVEELVPIVTTHIRVAREIGQIATSLADTVQRYVDAAPAVDASGEFNIIKDEIHNLFDESSFVGFLNRPSSIPNKPARTNVCSTGRDFETILSFLLTGNDKTDKCVKDLISTYDANWLENIWYGFFASGFSVSSVYGLHNLFQLPPGERAAVSFIGNSIATKLFGNIPKDACGNLSSFESNLADLRDTFLVALQGGYSEYQNQIKSKIIVTIYKNRDRVAIVNGSSYRTWLEEGGSPELILGALLTNNPAYSSEEFALRGNEFKRQWGGFCIIHNADSDLRRSNFLRGIYLACFTETMGNIAPFEEAFRKANTSFAEQAILRAEALLISTGLDALSDLSNICLELIAGIRFDYTPAKMILKDIDSVRKANPDVDPREAALVASSNYLALYLVTQMGIGKV